MSIISVTTPPIVSLDQNPIQVEIESNLSTEQDVIDFLRVGIQEGSAAVGQQIELAYSDVVIVFTFAAAADFSGNTLSVQQAGQDLQEYKAQLRQEMRRNYDLVSNFNFGVDIGTINSIGDILLYPKVANLDFQYESDADNITLTRTLFDGFTENAQIVLLVFVYNQDTDKYDRFFEHRLPIISYTEQVIFDIQKDFALRYQLPSSASIRAEDAQRCTENWTRFRLQYAEAGGSPPSVKALTENEKTFTVLHGKQGYARQYESWWTFFEFNQRFLTERLLGKPVTMRQPEWLYWMARKDGQYFLNIVVTYLDGNTNQFPQEIQVDLLQGEVGVWAVGFQQLGFDCYEDNPIVSYTVQLLDGFLPASAPYGYIVEADEVSYERYYLFGNAWGGMDTIRTTGKREENSNLSRQTAVRVVTPEVIADARGSDLSYDHRNQKTFTQHSGYLSVKDLKVLDDLLRIGKAWEIDVNGSQFTPILIDQQSIEITKDENDLESIRWSFRYAFEE